MDIKDISIRDIVRVHPACDLFMRGVTSGTVVKVGRKWVHIQDTFGRGTFKVSPRNLITD